MQLYCTTAAALLPQLSCTCHSSCHATFLLPLKHYNCLTEMNVALQLLQLQLFRNPWHNNCSFLVSFLIVAADIICTAVSCFIGESSHCTHTSQHLTLHSHLTTPHTALTPNNTSHCTHTSQHLTLCSHLTKPHTVLTPHKTSQYAHTSQNVTLHSHLSHSECPACADAQGITCN